MMRARNGAGRAARGALAAAALVATLPALATAQTAAPAAPAAPAATPAAPPPGTLSESVAAVVNDSIISTFDLTRRMRLLIATSGVQPTQQNLPQFQREALISLVDERLQLQELRRVEREQKIDIVANDQDIDAEIAQMARGNNMTAEQFMGVLKAQGVAESLREQIRAQVSWTRWIRGRYGSRLRVGEDQITAAQQAASAAASKPQYRIGEIFIDAARVGGMETAMSGATQLVDQMQKGAPFPAVARQFSASPTAATGGDAGWVAVSEVPAEVGTALENMRPGQLSRPIPVRDGVYIVYLRDKRTGSGGTLVSLKQIALPLPADATPAQIEAASAKLAGLRPSISNCNAIDGAAAKVPGAVAGDLGEADPNDLAPAIRDAAQGLQVGQVSAPVRTSAGVHLIALCGKRAAGDSETTSREAIENRLYAQQLSMIARRYMRDLRSSATIETR